jgi:hypothetical protein
VEPGAYPNLTAAARAEAQRILDSAARRLLTDQLDRDPANTTARSDQHPSDHRTDQRPPLRDSQQLPVRGRAHDQGGAEAA